MSFIINPFVHTPGEIGGGSLPTYQAQTAITGTTGSNSPPWPTHLTDDIALYMIQTVGAQAANLSVPAGFVEIAHFETGSGTNGSRITVFWCRATSAAMATPTCADAGDHIISQIMTFRGCVTSGNPWNVYSGGVKDPASTSCPYPDLTTTLNNCLIVLIGTRDATGTGAAWSSTLANANLTGLVEKSDAGSVVGVGGGLTVGNGAKATAGAVGVTTSTVTSSINAMMMIALKGP